MRKSGTLTSLFYNTNPLQGCRLQDLSTEFHNVTRSNPAGKFDKI